MTVTGDGVSTSGSSPQIVLEANNTLSWGINECSSSFQSISSCETLESYEPADVAVTVESPQVIVVPFLADNAAMPIMKECSIRIDPLKIAPIHGDETIVGKIIELPTSTNFSQTVYAASDDDCSVFEGFDVDSTYRNHQLDLYKRTVTLMEKRARVARTVEPARVPPVVNEPVLNEHIVTERHLIDRHKKQPTAVPLPPERNNKTETVKRPRRKVVKQSLPNNQTEATNQSSTEKEEVTVVVSKENHVTKPSVVPIPERVSSPPVESVNIKCDKQDISSDSDSDVIAGMKIAFGRFVCMNQIYRTKFFFVFKLMTRLPLLP